MGFPDGVFEFCPTNCLGILPTGLGTSEAWGGGGTLVEEACCFKASILAFIFSFLTLAFDFLGAPELSPDC